MKQVGVLVLSVLVLLLLQATILPQLLSAAVKPDLLLIFTVSCGLLCGREKAVGIGFFSGLLQDLASGNIFGIHTLSKMAIGYLAGLAEQKVFKEHIFLPMAAMLVASLLNSALMLALMTFLGYRIGWSAAMSGEILPSLLYNVLFSVPVHQTVYRLAKRWD
ncbi:rod shape-determining protein MreD [Anaerosporomusa subterranea]|uniref:Rod shape-determining protein MreD n=1 Tax=Anaerosporomusa subterranea TaxID=1794912 RepID=A0A154BN36_ANASB|nr:rod shape-determining protein MreD [Anaerosporomusa subterranea]KYZ75403.1 rod shape-determining protein MreD [Anaerosporomusa subterranea]